MTLGPTFREWLEYSHNNEDDKDLYVQYIVKLHDNILVGFSDYQAVPEWKQLLSLVHERIGETDLNEEYVFLRMRYLSRSVDDFKQNERKYFEVFGENFGWRNKETNKISVYDSVGYCKTSLDQFTRYLRGVPGELARHADRVRDHYDAKLRDAREAQEDTLVLENEWKVMRNLACDPQSTVSAMLVTEYKNKHQIDKIEHRSKKFIVHFRDRTA